MWVRWVLVGLALLCAGCELRLEVEAVFDRDAGGHLEVALTADAELLGQAQAAGTDPLGDLAATGRELAAQGWQVADTTDDAGRRTVSLTASFDGPEAFERLTAELAEALAAPEVELLAPMVVTLEEERLTVAGSAGLQPTAVVTEHGLTPAQLVSLLRDEAAFSYVVRIGLPGEVLATTGERDDGMLRWTVAPGEQVVIEAVGRRPQAPVWPLVAGAIGGALFGALVLRRVAVIRRRAR